MNSKLKPRLKIIFSVAFTSAIIGLSVLSYNKIIESKKAEEKVERLPEFELNDVHSDYLINHNNILSDRPKLLVFFNSHCDYYTHELTALNNVRHRLIESNVVLFSPEHPDTLHRFITQFNFDECENIYVGLANPDTLFNWFGQMAPHQFCI